jgi:protocatechuate 3,4-dioxygenase beta subunit
MNPKEFASIEGTVLDETGQPVREVPVMIQWSDQLHHDIAVVTDDQGGFRLDGLRPGSYTLAAYSPAGEAVIATTTTFAGRVSKITLAAGSQSTQ